MMNSGHPMHERMEQRRAEMMARRKERMTPEQLARFEEREKHRAERSN